MPRIRFRTRVSSPASRPTLGRCLAGPLFTSLLVLGCVQQGPAPDAIPDVPPLDYSIASEVPAGSISTVPGEQAPPPVSAHAPVLPSEQTPAPMTPATPAPHTATPQPVPPQAQSAPAPAPTAHAAPARPMSPQEQRVAALELTLLNMSNELAWLQSQPANPTTPWGTPSPKVVPEAPATPPVPDQPQPASPSKKERASLAAKAEQQQAERISTLEKNIQTVQAELAQLRNQPAGTTPWGTTTPDAAQIQAEAKAAPAPAPVPMSERKPTQTVGELPTRPEPPQAPVPPAVAPAPQTPPPPPPINPDTMAKYPVTVPFAEVADKTIPPPSREAIATPPLKNSRPARGNSPAVQPVQPAQPMQPVQPVQPAQQGQQAQPAHTPSAPAQAYTPAAPSPVAATPAVPSGTSTRPAALPQTQTPPPAKGEKAVYQAAYNAYEGKRYNEAWNAFDSYLESYPNGRYAPNALYWKGEVRYSLGDYAGSIMLFKDVIARYPKHAKAPDALLKIIMCYNRLQDRDNASLHLRILNEDYPSSEAARRAKRMGLS